MKVLFWEWWLVWNFLDRRYVKGYILEDKTETAGLWKALEKGVLWCLDLGGGGPWEHTEDVFLNECAFHIERGFPSGSVVKNLLASRRCRRRTLSPRVGKSLWRRAWQPTPVFLPRESHGRRSLAGREESGQKWLKRLTATHAIHI